MDHQQIIETCLDALQEVYRYQDSLPPAVAGRISAALSAATSFLHNPQPETQYSQNQSYQTPDDATASSSPLIPLELFRPIVRCSHPVVGRNNRCLNKHLSYLVTVEDLVRGEAGWRQRYQGQKTCFIWAARKGHLELVRDLLDGGVDVHVDEDAALRLAAAGGHLEVVCLLLDAGANVHAMSYNSLAPAEARRRYSEVCRRRLLDSQADIPTIRGDSLFWAATFGHLEVVRLLLDAGANIHSWCDAPLIFAAHRGHAHVVRLLLDRGADINAQDGGALLHAAEEGHLEVVRVLLDRRAAWTNVYHHDRPLLMAASAGHLEIVRLFVNCGARADAWPLRGAAANGHVEVVRLLSDSGADRYTAHYALREVVRVGLKASAKYRQPL
ncbi:hypothetical protein HK104_001695 [Borealophlyctis nickersoniae]|nr:hypothetical protein HK104_001695 [Borealophlyctis nickersoniae]